MYRFYVIWRRCMKNKTHKINNHNTTTSMKFDCALRNIIVSSLCFCFSFSSFLLFFVIDDEKNTSAIAVNVVSADFAMRQKQKLYTSSSSKLKILINDSSNRIEKCMRATQEKKKKMTKNDEKLCLLLIWSGKLQPKTFRFLKWIYYSTFHMKGMLRSYQRAGERKYSLTKFPDHYFSSFFFHSIFSRKIK